MVYKSENVDSLTLEQKACQLLFQIIINMILFKLKSEKTVQRFHELTFYSRHNIGILTMKIQ